MTTEEPPPGTIITFYSYKGGTGRSMAVANAACWLGRKVSTSSRKALVMDWDLEAPGLHRFFAPQVDRPENVARPGIINYFDALHKKLKQNEGLYAELVSEWGWKVLDRELPLDDYIIPNVLPGVDFIKAGEFNAAYTELVSAFNWVEFYSQFGDVIETFRLLIVSKYTYCLIDSRTGFTDISGICTMLMPEKLITVFTPNHQSLSGVIDLLARAAAYRRASNDFRPLSVFPLPSRIENAELGLKKDWRARYQAEFEGAFRHIYQLEKCELSDYFDEVQLPHIAYYAYGESIAMHEERSDALSLSRAYENFFQRLIELDFPWDKRVAAVDIQEEAQPEVTLVPNPGGLAHEIKRLWQGSSRPVAVFATLTLAAVVAFLLYGLLRVISPAPPPNLSGKVEQIVPTRVRDTPEVFIQLSVVNNGPPTTVSNYSLQITSINSREVDSKEITPVEFNEVLPVFRSGALESITVYPQESMIRQTTQKVGTGQTTRGWLRFSIPVPMLDPQALRRPGLRYVVSFADDTGKVSYVVHDGS